MMEVRAALERLEVAMAMKARAEDDYIHVDGGFASFLF
jgi:hypothetical protein